MIAPIRYIVVGNENNAEIIKHLVSLTVVVGEDKQRTENKIKVEFPLEGKADENEC